MEVVNIQGNNNWSQVMHIVAKTKKAVQQIAEDDPLLYQVGVSSISLHSGFPYLEPSERLQN